MHQYGFKDKFIGMIQSLFYQFESCIVSNGHISPFFDITRSVHQGSPISSFLFLICSQVQTYLMKSNPQIKGVNVNGAQYLISQFADDTDLYLNFDQQTIDTVIQILERLERNIGLKVNYDKTTIYRMGSVVVR